MTIPSRPQHHAQRNPALFFYSEEMGRFDFGAEHPFKPERAIKTFDLCRRYGVMHYPWMEVREPESLDPNLLTLFHDSAYLGLLRKAGRGKVSLAMLEHGLGTRDNPIVAGIYEWVLEAAGATRMAVQAVLADKAAVAFNPYGGFHHAMPDHAEGFCYLNDVAVTVIDALRSSPQLKVAYIDIDAHHGNGVQHAFYEDKRVLFVSLHETGKTLYPWSGSQKEIGEGPGRGFTVNLPLEAETDDEIYAFVFDSAVLPLVRSFEPDIIVAELGADTLISDPLTHLKLTNNGYQKTVQQIRDLCPRVVGLGGGGYDLYRTARCWTLAWSILNRVEPADEFAGLVGGMMFGPEMEVGSLYDHPYQSTGEIKKQAFEAAVNVVEYIKREIFPIHGI